MKLKVNKADKETFDITELTLLELKSIHRGLLTFAEQCGNRQISTLAATIHSALLKDRVTPLSTPADIEAIKRRDRAMMATLNGLTPVSHTFLPMPY